MKKRLYLSQREKNKIKGGLSYEENNLFKKDPLNKIVLSIIPNNAINEKGKMLYDINCCQKMINGGKTKLNQKRNK